MATAAPASSDLSQLLSHASLSPRSRIRIDDHWKFHLGDLPDAQNPQLDDAPWRSITLPHDWSIEGHTDPKNPMGGNSGFFPAGIAWYRYSFLPGADLAHRHLSLEFEGIYQRATLYLNGQQIASHPYGYTSFHVNLTGKLILGQTNILAIRVDNSAQPNCRWYSGSGIYRHVWLTVRNPVHICPYGVFASTSKLSADSATVRLETNPTNTTAHSCEVTLQSIIASPEGQELARAQSSTQLAPGATAQVEQQLLVPHPALWSPQSPTLHKVVSTLTVAGKITDTLETSFGIRTVAWSSENGLQINGQTVKLNGGCLHHDNGPLGAAAFDRAEFRRVEILKDAGFNALRTSHNPPSPAFLDACDRLGMLVMDEVFDHWQASKTAHDYHLEFQDWSLVDTESMVARDFNHPSVVIWSVGNEMNERFLESGQQIGQTLAAKVRALDSSRPVTAAVNGPWKPGEKWEDGDKLFALLDLAGYNYHIHFHQTDIARVPGRIIVSTESLQSETFANWAFTEDHSYILGDFLWTALDYLGEAGIGRWHFDNECDISHGVNELYPWHGAYCGDIDITGFRKPISHYRNIVWNRGEKLYITVLQPQLDGPKIRTTNWGLWPNASHWTWPNHDGRLIQIHVYSRCDSVQLFLNGHLINEKPTTRAQQFRAEFTIPYAPGTLKAIGLIAGKPAAEYELRTAGNPAAIRLTPDRSTLRADAQDLSYITVEITDHNGQLQPNADHSIQFTIDGPATIAGIGSADLKSLEPYQTHERRTFQGRALVVLRTTHQPGPIRLTAQSPNLTPAHIIVNSQ